MAKKTTKKKTTKKKPASKKPAAKKKVTKKSSTAKKSSTKKTATKKKTTKKAPAKSSTKTTKKTTKKSVAKKTTKKKTVKKTPVKKTTTKKPVSKKKTTKKPASTKPSPKSKTTKKAGADKPATPAPGAKTTPATPGKDQDRAKKVNRRRSSKPKAPLVLPDRPLLGSMKNIKPLIASGSASNKKKSVLDGDKPKKIKSPYNKRQLDVFKAILLSKRAELLGDITHLEDEALKSGSGDSGHTTNHISEQGSDNYDQALNLNLAAADRNLIIEIDEALIRITDRTYGACMITGEPIKKARLEELPWTKYSVAAARELDQRGR